MTEGSVRVIALALAAVAGIVITCSFYYPGVMSPDSLLAPTGRRSPASLRGTRKHRYSRLFGSGSTRWSRVHLGSCCSRMSSSGRPLR